MKIEIIESQDKKELQENYNRFITMFNVKFTQSHVTNKEGVLYYTLIIYYENNEFKLDKDIVNSLNKKPVKLEL